MEEQHYLINYIENHNSFDETSRKRYLLMAKWFTSDEDNLFKSIKDLARDYQTHSKREWSDFLSNKYIDYIIQKEVLLINSLEERLLIKDYAKKLKEGSISQQELTSWQRLLAAFDKSRPDDFGLDYNFVVVNDTGGGNETFSFGRNDLHEDGLDLIFSIKNKGMIKKVIGSYELTKTIPTVFHLTKESFDEIKEVYDEIDGAFPFSQIKINKLTLTKINGIDDGQL